MANTQMKERALMETTIANTQRIERMKRRLERTFKMPMPGGQSDNILITPKILSSQNMITIKNF